MFLLLATLGSSIEDMCGLRAGREENKTLEKSGGGRIFLSELQRHLKGRFFVI